MCDKDLPIHIQTDLVLSDLVHYEETDKLCMYTSF